MDLSVMKTLRPGEIPQVIEKAALFGGTITQTGVHMKSQAVVSKIEKGQDNKIVLYLSQSDAFDPTRPFLINLAYRNLTFRALPHQYTMIGDIVVCSLPKEAKALILRNGDRFILPYNSEVHAKIHRIEKRDFFNQMEVRVVDVSQYGLGLHLKDIPLGTLCRFDHLWLKKICDHNLESPLFGKIEYVKERKYQNATGDFRVGMSLDKALPENIFEELIKKCGLILSA